MKELDVLLERFARRELPTASAEERRTLGRFLELPDPLLMDYLLGQANPGDAELAQLILRIIASVPRAASPPPLQSASPAPNPSIPGS
jgi:succinate dehydrogenase flavin-adding protein (antitoxin of CptAB toxin-antitoxin module)